MYSSFIAKNNKIPNKDDCCIKNNLVRSTILSKILKENNLTYKDFYKMVGIDKLKHDKNNNKIKNKIEQIKYFVEIDCKSWINFKLLDVCYENNKYMLELIDDLKYKYYLNFIVLKVQKEEI